MVFQDLLTNKDDYLRASRALLREIIKQTKHEINFQAFCLGLMQERKEPQYLDMEFKVCRTPPQAAGPHGLRDGCGGGAAVSGVRRPPAPPGRGSLLRLDFRRWRRWEGPPENRTWGRGWRISSAT